jgi:O-antigen biosynthesis protein
MKTQTEFIRELRAELAAKERELSEQKWIFEQFLQSPTWRWTAPVRWVVRQLMGRPNGDSAAPPIAPDTPEQAADLETLEPATVLDGKSVFANLCRISLENFFASGATLELPQSANPVISIILVLYNRAELTLACLRSIAENRNEEIEVVIVDNASVDETPQLLKQVRGARILSNITNRHFLAGVNQAARECRGEYILLLNNDAQLMTGALTNALRTIRMSPDIGAVGGKIILLDGTLQEAGSIVWQDGSCAGYGRGDDPIAPMYTFRRDVDFCSGAFLLTPRKIWEELRGFDNVFEPAYYEETDYCLRLWQRGLRVVYEPAATILHYEFASSESVSLAIDLQAKNQKIFAERHRDALQKQDRRGSDRIVYARSRNADRRILYIDDRVPHMWLGSGFPRAHAWLRSLLNLGYFVTLYALAVIDEPWDSAYSDFPREIEIMKGMGRDMLQLFLRTRRDYYSTIIISRPHNMEAVTPIWKAHPEWFENVDVLYDAEAVFVDRQIGLRKLAGNPMTDEEIRNAFSSEIQLTSVADRVVTVSERDRQTFKTYGVEQVEVLGHSVEAAATATPFEAREGLLFVGAVHEERSPNGDSLIWFLSEVFPQIRKTLGDIPFTIAGLNKSERIRELARAPVQITGQLPSLEELYRKARLFVAPTRYAAGIPIKIQEAAARGVPVVATPLLAEHLGWSDRELAIGKDAEGFAAQCIEVYTNAVRWKSLRDAALERVQRECSPQAFETDVRQILAASKVRGL